VYLNPVKASAHRINRTTPKVFHDAWQLFQP
jgi:hypothetical protein